MTAEFLSAIGAYTIACATPGPSNLAIMRIALREGRTSAMSFASGVIAGSITWGVITGSGLSAALTSSPALLSAVRLLGAGYLLYISGKSFLTVIRSSQIIEDVVSSRGRPSANFFAGLVMHLTNPKAILGWVAVIALGVGGNGSGGEVAKLLGSCFLIGLGVFLSYALLFTNARAVEAYRSLQRPLEIALAVFFGAAGLSLLLLSVQR